MNYNKLLKAIDLFKEWLEEEQSKTLEGVKNGTESVNDKGSGKDEPDDIDMAFVRAHIADFEPDYNDSDLWSHPGSGNASVVEHPSDPVEPTDVDVVESKEAEANADTFCDKNVAPAGSESLSACAEGVFKKLSQEELQKLGFKELRAYYKKLKEEDKK